MIMNHVDQMIALIFTVDSHACCFVLQIRWKYSAGRQINCIFSLCVFPSGILFSHSALIQQLSLMLI